VRGRNHARIARAAFPPHRRLLGGGAVTILVTGDVHVAKVGLGSLLLSGLGVPAALR